MLGFWGGDTGENGRTRRGRTASVEEKTVSYVRKEFRREQLFDSLYARRRTYTNDCFAYDLLMASKDSSLQSRTLRRAALLLGGESKLAEFLDIEGWLVSRWLEGLGHPPDFIFSRCTDLIEPMSRSEGLKAEVNEGSKSRSV